MQDFFSCSRMGEVLKTKTMRVIAGFLLALMLTLGSNTAFGNDKELPPRQTVILTEKFKNSPLTVQFGEGLLVEQLKIRARLFAWVLEKKDWNLFWELSTPGFREDALGTKDREKPEAERKLIYTQSLRGFFDKGCMRFFPAPEIKIITTGGYALERPFAIIHFIYDVEHHGIQVRPWRMKMEVLWRWEQWDENPWNWYWGGTLSDKRLPTEEKIAPCKPR